MKNADTDFEAQKNVVLKAAREQGIIDVVSANSDSITLDNVELATKLMKKHGAKLHEAVKEERESKK